MFNMRFIELLALLSTALAAPLLQVEQGATVVPGQHIIKLKHDEAAVSASAVQALTQSLSTALKFSYSLSGFHGFAGTLSDTELAKLHASEHVGLYTPQVSRNHFG
jgi:cerevisin